MLYLFSRAKKIMSKRKILIIDDDPWLGEMYKIKFEKEGFDVYVEINGLDGIKTAKKIKPETILLDVMMPIIDGFETLQILREDKNYYPIIAMISNLSRKVEIDKALNCGADTYIVKANYTPQEMVCRVNDLIMQKNKETKT